MKQFLSNLFLTFSLPLLSLAQSQGTPIDYLPSGVKLEKITRGEDSNTVFFYWYIDSAFLSQDTAFYYTVCLENHLFDTAFSHEKTVQLYDTNRYTDTVFLYHDYYLHELVYGENTVTRFNYANKSPHLFEDWEHKYPRYSKLGNYGVGFDNEFILNHQYSDLYLDNEGNTYNFYTQSPVHFLPTTSLSFHPVSYNTYDAGNYLTPYNGWNSFQRFTDLNGNLINGTVCDTFAAIPSTATAQVQFSNITVAETHLLNLALFYPSTSKSYYSIRYYRNDIYTSLVNTIDWWSPDTIQIKAFHYPQLVPNNPVDNILRSTTDVFNCDTLVINGVSEVYSRVILEEDTSIFFICPFNPYHFNDNLKYCPYVLDSVCLLDGIEINGEMVYQEGLYFDSLLTAWGTDSILARQLHLKVPEVMDTIDALFCLGDSFISYGNVFTQPGNYFVDPSSTLVCDTGLLLRLETEDLSTGVAYDITNSTVYTTENNGNADYQWYTEDGTPISGAISNGYQVTSNNGYYCVITGENCMFTTEVIEAFGVSLEEWDASSVSLYPNPSEDMLNISSSTPLELVTVYNSMGKKVFSSKGNTRYINLSQFAPGMYIVEISLENQVKLEKKILKI